jgi:hypothetical protein
MEQERIRRTLIKMVQTGALQAFIGCKDHERARVEFWIQHVYEIRVNRRTIVMHERDVETVKRFANRRWKSIRPIVLDAGSVVLDRASGKILQASDGADARPLGKRGLRSVRIPIRKDRPISGQHVTELAAAYRASSLISRRACR